MGCDIHMVAERKVNGEWATVQNFSLVSDKGLVDKFGRHGQTFYRAELRNYEYFGALTKGTVRGREDPDGLGCFPRGFPDDASILANAMWQDWGLDAHSPSWMYADEYAQIYMKYIMDEEETTKYVTDRMNHGVSVWRQIFEEHLNIGVHEGAVPEDFRVIFWFDN